MRCPRTASPVTPPRSGGLRGGTITLALNQTATCTITLDDGAGTLNVVTEVVNDDGGQAERDDFDAHVKRNGAEVASSPQPGAGAPGTAYTLAAGTYAVPQTASRAMSRQDRVDATPPGR